MRKILILSLLFLLIAGGAEAEQFPWEYYIPIDEMTGEKDYGREKVTTSVIMAEEGWLAALQLFCKTGHLLFGIGDVAKNPNLRLDTSLEDIILLR